MGAFRAYPPQDFDAVDPGHDDVQEHRVRQALVDRLKTFFPAAGDDGLVPFALESLGHDERHLGVIVDDQNSHNTPP